MCQHLYMLQYVLGIKGEANVKADKGNITHKALELLARKKLADQNGERTFKDDETGTAFPAATFGPREAIEFAWHYYTEVKSTPHAWSPRDLTDCTRWMKTALEYNGGQFSPLNRTIVCPEQYFDFPIEQPWAKYSYALPDGTKLDGTLAIKGTVDLVTELNEDTIEYCDWKTGRRLDWATDEEKTPEKLRNDPQLRLYHYALTRLHPRRKFVIMTIFFLRDGGPFSFAFGPEDLAKTEDMLRRRFEAIRDTGLPRQRKTWRCTKFCWFGMNKQPGTDKTVCEYYHDEMVALGMDRVMAKHGKTDAFKDYGEGGGRTGKK